VADRVAWDEATVDVLAPVAAPLHRLQSVLRPIMATNQMIHGDLIGNVLFAPGLPPAIIDISPYWRPAAFADAIIAVDGLLWFGADTHLLRAATDGPDAGQMLARALIFRLIALNEHARADPSQLHQLAGFADAIDTVVGEDAPR
jgi:uncharacterized protein (TIGR02569 family)